MGSPTAADMLKAMQAAKTMAKIKEITDVSGDAAQQLYDQFAAFLEVGFTRDEAIQLVCEMLGAARGSTSSV